MKTLKVLAAMAILASCTKTVTDDIEPTIYNYLSRKCDFVSIGHSYRLEVGSSTGNPDLKDTYAINPLTGNSIKTEDYLMFLQTSNFDSAMLSNYLKSAEYAKQRTDPFIHFADEPDKSMESQIENYLRNNSSSTKSASLPAANVERIEYRLTGLKKLNISSSSKLFGEPARSSLNKYIEIFTGPYDHKFIFSADRQLVASIERGWELDYYINMQPIVFSGIYLRFKSTPSEAPLQTSFTVEMEVEGGKIIKATSKPVNLTQ